MEVCKGQLHTIAGSSCGDSSHISIAVSSDVSSGDCSIENDASVTSPSLCPGAEEKDRKDTVVLKHLVCSCEGFNDVNDDNCSKVLKRRRTVSQRCGCKVKIVVKYMSEDRYFALSFVEEHNHPLASASGRQFLRANREMTLGLRNIVFDGAKVNIGGNKVFNFAKEMMGGYSNVGATLRDFRNLNHYLKCYVGEKDGQMMIEKFKVMTETCEPFYYAYDVDSAGHLTKLFGTDAIGQRNFEIYGAAVSFDATFDTNKQGNYNINKLYNLIFAPFTGVDKNDKCVTFASCLLSQESVADYSWEWDVGVPASFSSLNGLVASKHGLCIWHILQTFPVKLGNHLCKETYFMEKMKIYICSSNIDIDEFERGWEAVIKELKLEGNKWLADIYEIRSSWIPTFFRDEPMFGLMHTTSRQRNKIARLDHETTSSILTTVLTRFIEDYAADLFMRTLFYKVQEEIFASCVDMKIKRMSEEVEGVIHLEIKDVKVKDKLFKVSVSLNHAVFSCKKFVMCGIVCRHAFCGLKQLGVTKIPRSLVLNCWMKIADSGTSSNSVALNRLDYVHRTIRQLNIDLVNHDGEVVEFPKKDYIAAMVGEKPLGELTVFVPKVCKNKGNYFKRLICEREKSVMKSKKRI
ncbi:hypothetical protein POM88_021774 [Heracleum sosnowskyi]|uniref:FAR1 domain-containing protein n=1 Tax=Heracleum sosnowskyi TaxID=360622 RepID=A0AAD8IE12_9APIA|nr:hypothetical protein POM88_021774 [Heracleum sosnowskyi]